jgi:hypothetical protein
VTDRKKSLSINREIVRDLTSSESRWARGGVATDGDLCRVALDARADAGAILGQAANGGAGTAGAIGATVLQAVSDQLC